MKSPRSYIVILFILISLSVSSLIISLFSEVFHDFVNLSSWASNAFLNFGTEMLGAAITFTLIDLILSQHQREEEERQREKEKLLQINMEKQALIIRMKVGDNSIAKEALERFKLHDWHKDGSFNFVDLAGAKLNGCNFYKSNMMGADLAGADLRNAKLVGVDLRGANLAYADLRGADLTGVQFNRETRWQGAIFDERTVLPNGSRWERGMQFPNESK